MEHTFAAYLGASRQLTAEKNGMIVYVQHDGEQIPVDVAPDATVRDLIAAAIDVGLPITTRISFDGRPLTDPEAELSDLGICAEAQLTASMPSPFEYSDEFEIDGAFATLKSSSDHGIICFVHKTNIGQESMMRLRILNGSAKLWAQDTSRLHAYTETKVFSSFAYVGVGFMHDNDREVHVQVKAEEQNKVTVKYKDSRQGRLTCSRTMIKEYSDIHKITEQSQIQICVKLERSQGCLSDCPPRIEFVDSELSE